MCLIILALKSGLGEDSPFYLQQTLNPVCPHPLLLCSSHTDFHAISGTFQACFHLRRLCSPLPSPRPPFAHLLGCTAPYLPFRSLFKYPKFKSLPS